jgi:hypothetical protein
VLLRAFLVFWFWIAPLLALAAGWPGLAAVITVDLVLGWQGDMGAGELLVMAGTGAGATAASWALGRRYPLRELLAAVGMGLALGLVTRPIVGLLGGGVLPYLELSRHPRRVLLLAFSAPLVRVLAALAFGLWLLLALWQV